jgi:hypothetical protein
MWSLLADDEDRPGVRGMQRGEGATALPPTKREIGKLLLSVAPKDGFEIRLPGH